MKLIDKLAYKAAINWIVAYMNAYDYEEYDAVKAIPSFGEDFSHEDLNDFLGIVTSDLESGKPFDYGGEKPIMWFWYVIRNMQTFELATWLAKREKKMKEQNKDTERS